MRFVDALRAQRPRVLERLEADEAVQQLKRQEQRKLADLFRGPAGRPALATVRVDGEGEGLVGARCAEDCTDAGPGPKEVPFSFAFSFA